MSKNGIVWKDWNPQGVKDHVKEQVAERMETACVVVEGHARKNLMAIEWRPRFKKYRQVFLVRLLRHEIEVDKNFVEGRVGILNPPGTTHSKAGFKIETGTSKVRAQPWLRPALFNNVREILKSFTDR